MIGFELKCDFVLVENIFVSGIHIITWKFVEKILKMKMKNEEEKNQLPVELFYNYHFHISESSILEHYHCENSLKKTIISSKNMALDVWIIFQTRIYFQRAQNHILIQILYQKLQAFLLPLPIISE